MKKYTILFFFMVLLSSAISAEENGQISFAIHILAGGRYDDVRMCVGSPAGIKGGPIMDAYFDIRYSINENSALILNIPIFRPILFGAAFQMLQFEPQLSYEYCFGQPGQPRFVVGAGLGLVFHYGPDYKSSADNKGESFFAMGPLVSAFSGILLEGNSGNWMPGLRLFYSPLFSPDYKTGQVLGGGLELHYEF